MVRNLKFLYIAILACMIIVTTWASLESNVIEGFVRVWQDRWGLATLCDAYFGFLSFYLWVAYKENSLASRITWFIAIVTLGNIAMAFYMLKVLSRLPKNPTMSDILLRKPA